MVFVEVHFHHAILRLIINLLRIHGKVLFVASACDFLEDSMDLILHGQLQVIKEILAHAHLQKECHCQKVNV